MSKDNGSRPGVVRGVQFSGASYLKVSCSEIVDGPKMGVENVNAGSCKLRREVKRVNI